jgi:predicted peroxiredoxin
MAEHEKLVVMVTHGPEDPELATIPFAMAGAAVASDVEVVMGFQGQGCRLMRRGVAETVSVPEFAPLPGLIESIRELGGTFLVCAPSVKSLGIEEELIEGTEICAAARLVAEVTSATSTLTY